MSIKIYQIVVSLLTMECYELLISKISKVIRIAEKMSTNICGLFLPVGTAYPLDK